MGCILDAYDAAQAAFVEARQSGVENTDREEAVRDVYAILAVEELRAEVERWRSLAEMVRDAAADAIDDGEEAGFAAATQDLLDAALKGGG